MKIGILMIGSLWWRTGSRETWRASRLKTKDSVHVRVPIHYGRKSKRDTYTMTFAPANEPGVARVVPCVVEGGAKELFAEAEALWGAEDDAASRPGVISAKWGCVGALFRVKDQSAEVKAWSEYFRRCGGKALAAVDPDGLLSIAWPQRVDGQPLDYDVLLATANVESAPVTPEEIALAWINKGQEEYFFENIKAGIRTSADEEIWRRMLGELEWLKRIDPKHAAVIAALRKEFLTVKSANVRIFAPECWGAVDKFEKLSPSTYTFPREIREALAGASAHFDRALLLRDTARNMIPLLQHDLAELEAKGHTHAENSRRLSAILESAITSLYSSLDCGRKVVTHVFKKYRGLPDSTRKTFQRAAKGELDPTLPAGIIQAFSQAPWYAQFCHLRDGLTHSRPGSCHRDNDTGAIFYLHDDARQGDKDYIPDIFAYFEERATNVNVFLGQIFTALLETLQDKEVQLPCGIFDGLLYMRKVRPREAENIHSGRCESHAWFDEPGKKRCPLADTCGAYQRVERARNPTPACYVPLFKIKSDASEVPFELNGTGILMLFRNHPLLVTAAHVVEECPQGIGVMLANDKKTEEGLVYCKKYQEQRRTVSLTNGGELEIFLPDDFEKTAIPPEKTRYDDLLDVAALWLDEETASRIWFGDIRFINVPEIPDCEIKPDTILRFAGFPGDPDRTPAKPLHTNNGAYLKLEPWAQEARLLPPEKYPEGFDHPDFPTASCFVAKYHDSFPVTRPGGMSGGPVLLDKEPFPILVGVSPNWREEGYFIGTKLSAVKDVLERAIGSSSVTA